MVLPIGATVRCRDGVAGRLKYVVIDPDDGIVTHLIVERGLLLRRNIVVPAAWVEQSSENEIVLNATLADLNALPEFKEVDFVEPDPSYRPLNGHQIEHTRIWVSPYGVVENGKPWILRHVHLGVDDHEVILRRGMPVNARDGRSIGVLDHLVVEPASQRVTHLVVRKGWLWNRQARIVPLERVAEVTEYGVRLDVTMEEFEEWPSYQPPATDEQIAASVRRALETDPRTRSSQFSVSVQGGVVHLVGEVTEAVMETARAIARRIRGVIGFSDEEAPLPAPRLRIGAPVYALDGRYGKLDKVVIDPYSRRVTHMIVRKGGLFTEDRVIPVERVARVDEHGIYLNAPAVELNQHPFYREESFVEPLPAWEELAPYLAANSVFWAGPYFGVAPPILPVIEYRIPIGVPEGEIVLERGAEVFYDGEWVGYLDHLLIDPASGKVTHLVVEELRRHRRIIVPAEWVASIDDGVVTLNRWEPDQPGAPAYEATRDDSAIQSDIESHFQADPALNSVQVHVDHGVAHLSGNVATVAGKAKADRIARSAPGVIGVRNKLSVDSVIYEQVTAALIADERTSLTPIEVIVDRAVVTLKGVVPALEVKKAAEEIARRVPGVLTVYNELEVRSKEETPKPERVLFVPVMKN